MPNLNNASDFLHRSFLHGVYIHAQNYFLEITGTNLRKSMLQIN